MTISSLLSPLFLFAHVFVTASQTGYGMGYNKTVPFLASILHPTTTSIQAQPPWFNVKGIIAIFPYEHRFVQLQYLKLLDKSLCNYPAHPTQLTTKLCSLIGDPAPWSLSFRASYSLKPDRLQLIPVQSLTQFQYIRLIQHRGLNFNQY